MAKRFTDTEKWDKRWFRILPMEYKLFWIYLCDKCDAAGVWDIDIEIAETFIGSKLDIEKAIQVFEGRIRKLNDTHLQINAFIPFQYGELSAACKPHKRVLSLIQQHEASKGFGKGLETLEDKDKEEDKDKKKKRGDGKPQREADKFNFEVLWARYPRKEGRKEAERRFNASVKSVQDWLDIQNALDNYISQLRLNHTELQYTKMGSTWFTNWRDYVNYRVNGTEVVKVPPAPPKPKVVEKREELSEKDLQEFHDQKVAKLGPCRDAGCQFCKVATHV